MTPDRRAPGPRSIQERKELKKFGKAATNTYKQMTNNNVINQTITLLIDNSKITNTNIYTKQQHTHKKFGKAATAEEAAQKFLVVPSSMPTGIVIGSKSGLWWSMND